MVCQYESRDPGLFRLVSNTASCEGEKACGGRVNSRLRSFFVRVAMGYKLEGVNAGKEGNNDFRVEVVA